MVEVLSNGNKFFLHSQMKVNSPGSKSRCNLATEQYNRQDVSASVPYGSKPGIYRAACGSRACDERSLWYAQHQGLTRAVTTVCDLGLATQKVALL